MSTNTAADRRAAKAALNDAENAYSIAEDGYNEANTKFTAAVKALTKIEDTATKEFQEAAWELNVTSARLVDAERAYNDAWATYTAISRNTP